MTGCLAQRYAEELAGSLPEVDAVVGFENYVRPPQFDLFIATVSIALRLCHSVESKNTSQTSTSNPYQGQIASEISRVLSTEGDLGAADEANVLVGLPTVPFREEKDRVRIGPQHYAYRVHVSKPILPSAFHCASSAS